MPPWKTLLPALVLLPALLARAAPAQAVRGELTEGETGRPVAGAFVVLLDEAGRQVGGSFTDAEGGFLVQAPAAGRYTLRAERVGRGSVRSPELRLAAGETAQHALVMAGEAVQLEGLVVQAEKRRCAALPEAGAQTAALWEEARKALNAAAWTQARRRFRFALQEYARMLDPSSLRVLSEQGQRVGGFMESPFVSAPAEQLAREGFVRQDGDSTVYYGPDARVLLSDDFLRTHCFRAQEGAGAERGLAGLAFEPVRGRRLPDVRGVLWLDPATAELRHLEYTYTGLDLSGPVDRLGGRVEFERLPTGEWIVPRWRIRMPVVGMDTVRVASHRHERRRVAGIRESGGEVLEVRATGGALIRSAARAALSGTVFDSTRAAPLAGARVRLAGTAVEVETDAQGRFRIADVAEGRYAVVFSHPRADSLEWTPRPVPLDLGRDVENTVQLAVPPLLAVLAARCTPGERRAGTGVVAGVVRQADGAAPRPGTPVLLTWPEGGGTPAGRALAWTDAAGSYVACSVPPGAAVEARAGTGAGAASRLRAAADAPTRHDLEAPAPAVAVAREVTLDPLVVSAGSPLERRTRASGARMDVLVREEIEAYRGVAFHVGDLVRRIPNVRVEEHQAGQTTGILAGVCVRETRRKQGSPCAAVIVDDLPSASGAEELARLNVAHLESIEWVPPVLAMSRYGARAEGGALVVYTRGNGPYARRPGS